LWRRYFGTKDYHSLLIGVLLIFRDTSFLSTIRNRILTVMCNHNLPFQYSLLFVALLALFLLDYSKNGFTLLA